MLLLRSLHCLSTLTRRTDRGCQVVKKKRSPKHDSKHVVARHGEKNCEFNGTKCHHRNNAGLIFATQKSTDCFLLEGKEGKGKGTEERLKTVADR